MANYYNKMINQIKSDYSIIDQQSFTAISVESGSPIGNQLFRFNSYDLQVYDATKKTWADDNPLKNKFFAGLWLPKGVK